MCSEYEFYAKAKAVDESIGFTINKEKIAFDQFEYYVRIYGQAPIITAVDGELCYEMATFSLLPPPPRFSTFNARLANWDPKQKKIVPIYDKSTWAKPFKDTPCLVPLSAFFEPIYTGDLAGTVQRFTLPNEEILFAAGIWKESPNPKAEGELYLGFALLMHVALDTVEKVGHHRSLIPLTAVAAVGYLKDSMTSKQRYDFLLKHRHVPELKFSTQRALAKGWEKRVKANIRGQ